MRAVLPIPVLLLTLLLLAGCVPPSAVRPPTAVDADWQLQMAQLRQEQADQARQLQRLNDNLLLMEGRLRDQQQLLQEVRVLTSQMVTPGGQKTGSAATLPGAASHSDATNRPASPTEIYLQAFANYASGRCSEAIGGFQEFLRQYPGNDYAGHALYWLGECYDTQQQHAAAADAFRQAVERAPQGGKAPDALLGLAASLQKLNRSTEAEEALLLLRQRYPDSAAARRALKTD